MDARGRRGFDISVASEVMAILALTTRLRDMRERFGRIVIGQTAKSSRSPPKMLKAAGAMTVLMKEAIKPNLFQTLENTPAFVHAGPFANIAHGNSSILADQIGIKTADYLITEAGFGADIGAEKFFNIKCRYSGLRPDAAVLVTTVRALKLHTGKYRIVPGRPLAGGNAQREPRRSLAGRGQSAQTDGKRAQTWRQPGGLHQPLLQRLTARSRRSLRMAQGRGRASALSNHWAEGGAGATDLARAVIEAAEEPTDFHFLYELDQPIKAKIETIAREIYGADGVSFEAQAESQIRQYEANGFGNLPICMAKTHLSLSHDPKLKGAPSGFTLPIREVRASVGAGFIYPLLGEMRTMPGLSSHRQPKTWTLTWRRVR